MCLGRGRKLRITLSGVTSVTTCAISCCQGLPGSDHRLILRRGQHVKNAHFFVSLGDGGVSAPKLMRARQGLTLAGRVARGLVGFLNRGVSMDMSFAGHSRLETCSTRIPLSSVPQTFTQCAVRGTGRSPPVLIVRFGLLARGGGGSSGCRR